MTGCQSDWGHEGFGANGAKGGRGTDGLGRTIRFTTLTLRLRCSRIALRCNRIALRCNRIALRCNRIAPVQYILVIYSKM